MSSKTKPYNPYAGSLNDTTREYKKLWEKMILTPADIKRLEDLNRKLIRLKWLVSVFEAKQNAR